jgi:hypothetical protein
MELSKSASFEAQSQWSFAMAMELFVLSDQKLETVAEWQAAIDAEGFPLRFDGNKPIEMLRGFLSAQLRDAKTGFECNLWPADELMRDRPDVNFGRDWKYVLAFRWGSNLSQVPAVWMAATAYAKATDGVVYDEEAGKIRTPAEAGIVVGEIEREMPQVEAMLQELARF